MHLTLDRLETQVVRRSMGWECSGGDILVETGEVVWNEKLLEGRMGWEITT